MTITQTAAAQARGGSRGGAGKPGGPGRRGGARPFTTGTAVRLIFAIFVTALFALPILLAVMGGLKTQGELQASPLSFPTDPQWGNYTSILRSRDFWQFLRNSIIVTGFVTLGVVTSCSATAFVFARVQFRGRELVFNYLMLGLLFPMAVAVLPLFVTVRSLGLTDKLLGLILVEIAFLIPSSIILMRGFFVTAVPQELQDAAYVDGCTEFGFFWRILLPLARPIITAVAVLTAVISWNIYLLPLLLMNSSERWTLPLGVAQFQGQYGTDWPSIMAFVSLSLVPTVVFYAFTEKHLVVGLTAGAVKG